MANSAPVPAPTPASGKRPAKGKASVIASGKGGVGKSTFTAGLGLALASKGRQVLLLDGDAALRSLDIMLGIATGTVYNMADIFAGRCDPGRAIYRSPLQENLYVIPAAVTMDSMGTPNDMRRLVMSCAQYFDDILIDSPAGLGPGFEAAIAGAGGALLVTTPDLVCARDAQITAQVLRERGLPIRLIINRLRPKPIQKGHTPNIDEVIDAAGVQLIGVIPEDEALAVATANGQPVPLTALAAQCFDNIARRYLGEVVPLAKLEKVG